MIQFNLNKMRNKLNITCFIGILFLTISGCHTKSKNRIEGNAEATKYNKIMDNDTTPKVTGIGGIFFKSKDPKKLREWYGKHLHLAISEYGSAFEFRNANRPDEINYLSWSPFDDSTSYFDPSQKEFMINYRVQNIEGLIRNLKASGVTIIDTIEEYEYGKFVHIMDSDGNKIELWEPNDSFFTKMGGPTTK